MSGSDNGLWFSRQIAYGIRLFLWWVIFGTVVALIFVLFGCALNVGSGSANTDASEEKAVSGTNRVVDVKLGK
jgi:hypothetical protein